MSNGVVTTYSKERLDKECSTNSKIFFYEVGD